MPLPPPAALPLSSPSNLDQVSTAIYNASSNTINVMMGSFSGGGSPSNADQVFTSIYNQADNAIQATCVSGCGGGGGGGVLVYSSSALTTGSTTYAPVGGGNAASATEANVQTITPSVALVSNLTVNLGTAPSGSASYAFTVRDNGTSQAVTCTITGSANSCTDTTHSFTTAANDKLDIMIIPSGSPVSSTVQIYMQFGVGGGTVTSVGLSLPSIFSVSGSPVTTSGTITGALANQSANLVFAGPSSGSPAAPTFRGIIATDLAASPANGECLGYNGSTLAWQACSTAWNTIANATGPQTLTQGYNSTWTFGASSGDMLDVTDSGAGANSQWELNLDTNSVTPSVRNPFRVGIQGNDQIKVMEFTGDNGGVIFGGALSNPWPSSTVDVAKYIFTNSTANFNDDRVINTSSTFGADLWQLRTAVAYNASTSPFNFITTGIDCSTTTGSSCTAGPFSVRGDGLTTATTFNATTGFEINGSFGTNGQCLTTTGSAAAWGSCGSGGTIPGSQYQVVTMTGTNTAAGNSQITTDSSGDLTIAGSFKAGSGSAGGAIAFPEGGTSPTPTAGQDILWANSSTHTLQLSENGGAFSSIGSGGGLPPYWTNDSTHGSLIIEPNSYDTTPEIIGPSESVLNPGAPEFEVFTKYLQAPTSGGTLTAVSGGTIPAGTVYGCVTYSSGTAYTPRMETPCDAVSNVAVSGSQGVTVSPPNFVSGATEWNFYGSQTSGGPYYYQASSTNFAGTNGVGVTMTLNSLATSGNTPLSTTTALAGKSFSADSNGTIEMPLTYNWTLGENNQPSASFTRLYGGIGAEAYHMFMSPALTPPLAPSGYTITTGGSGNIPSSTGSLSIAFTYANGPAANLSGGQGSYPETPLGGSMLVPASAFSSCSTNCNIVVPVPVQNYATAFNVYINTGTNWYLYNSSPIQTFTGSYTITSIPSGVANSGPGSNTTGGQFLTTISAAPGASGLACVNSGVPGYDCAPGTFIATNPMTEAGDLSIGGTVNAEGVAAPTVLHAGTSGQVLTSNGANAAPSWQVAGGGGGVSVVFATSATETAASVPSTTMVTPGANHIYRLGMTILQSAVATSTGCTLSVYTSWTDAVSGLAVTNLQLPEIFDITRAGGPYTTVALTSTSGNLPLEAQMQPEMIDAKAGDPVSYLVAYAGSCGSPSYTVQPVLEQLQ